MAAHNDSQRGRPRGHDGSAGGCPQNRSEPLSQLLRRSTGGVDVGDPQGREYIVDAAEHRRMLHNDVIFRSSRHGVKKLPAHTEEY